MTPSTTVFTLDDTGVVAPVMLKLVTTPEAQSGVVVWNIEAVSVPEENIEPVQDSSLTAVLGTAIRVRVRALLEGPLQQ